MWSFLMNSSEFKTTPPALYQGLTQAGWRVSGLLLVGALWLGLASVGCGAPKAEDPESGARPSAEPEPSWASQPEEYERASDDPEILREAILRLRNEVEALEDDRDRLTEELSTCQDRSEKYQAGLERAVDELNRRREALPRALVREAEGSRTSRRNSPSSRKDKTSFSIRNGPRISAIGADVRVTGKVQNSGRSSGYATVLVELTLDGEYLDSATTSVYVVAGEREPWEVTLYNASSDGILRATAEIE